MHDIFQIIQTVIVIAIAGFFAAIIIVGFIYQGKTKEITVVKKRVSEYKGLNSTRSAETRVKHFTIDCKYHNSDKIHTFRCNKMIFDRLKENKSYKAKIKLMEIIKIERG